MLYESSSQRRFIMASIVSSESSHVMTVFCQSESHNSFLRSTRTLICWLICIFTLVIICSRNANYNAIYIFASTWSDFFFFYCKALHVFNCSLAYFFLSLFFYKSRTFSFKVEVSLARGNSWINVLILEAWLHIFAKGCIFLGRPRHKLELDLLAETWKCELF